MAQTAGELGRRKLQTQGQKQQHDTDGRTGSDELTGGGHPKMPPLPNDKPANKYTGIGDNANRRATAPSTASTANRTPSSNNSALETSTGSALFDDLFDPGDPVLGADHDEDISGSQHISRARRGQHILVTHDRHNRRAGTGARTGITQRPVHKQATRPDVNLTGLKPGHLTRQLGKSLGDPRRTRI